MSDEKTSVYDVISDRIIALLEAGTVPWRKPWDARTSAPRSIRGHVYRGINAFLLAFRGYADPRWVTYKQAVERGGKVKKGEKGTPVVFWKVTEVEKTDPDTGVTKRVKVPFARYYTVFNVEQTEGTDIKPWEPGTPVGDGTPIESAESILAGYLAQENAPSVDENGGDRAYYVPATDAIHLPKRKSFRKSEAFYATAFHEVGHSTGHRDRLNRPGVAEFTHFGDQQYGREELVAEMTAAFLCAEASIAPTVMDNSASYIAAWLNTIKEDRRAVVVAAAQAQRAADLVMGRQRQAEGEAVAA